MEQATVANLLVNKFSPDRVMSMRPEQFCADLIFEGVVKSEADFNLIVLESIQRACVDDDEFPMHYYTKDEPMSESGRTVGDIECLTDDYIANMLSGS